MINQACTIGHVTQQALYLEHDNYQNFVWQHLPYDCEPRNHALVLCPPIGYEYSHSYRSYRYLADELAKQGFTVFRFDYYGTGNSSGFILDDDCLNRWVSDLKSLSSHIENQYSGIKQTWFGVRMGATLAYLSAEEGTTADLILWEPVIKGRSYIRELEALSLLAATPEKIENAYLESAGFLLSNKTAQDIKQINLLNGTSLSPNSDVLLISKDAKGVNQKLLESLEKNEHKVDTHISLEYSDMMNEPHQTKIPLATVKHIIDWLTQGHTNTPSIEITKTGPHSYPTQTNTHLDSVNETPLFFGKHKQLFGILTSPKELPKTSLKSIILVNSGSVNQVGPHDIYCKIARELAAEGHTILRIDLENIGDSLLSNKEYENHPYQPNALENIDAAINEMHTINPSSKITICGICSGAYNAFHSGLDIKSNKVDGILMINPLTFYWNKNQSLKIPSNLSLFKAQAHYKQSARDPEKWKKLLSGKINFTYLARFVTRKLIKQIQQTFSDLVGSLFGDRSLLSKDFKKLKDKNLKIGFIFSSMDPGLDIVKSEMKFTLRDGLKDNWIDIKVIPDADHTFSNKKARDRLLNVLKVHFAHQ